ELESAEAAVTALVDAATTVKPRPRFWTRARKRILAATVLGLVLVSAVSAAVVHFASGPRYRWQASSAGWGYPAAGTLDGREDRPVLFHTDQQWDPWVLIDLLEPRVIDKIVIENRIDCCRERTVPLVVEALDENMGAIRIGRTDAPFSKWIVQFPAR